jgi:hypothetical protein
MPDPFAPLRRLADTSDLESLDDEALGQRAKALTDALDVLPKVHAEMREARQTMGIELHLKRKVSLRKIAAMISRSPTRVKQIVEGERVSGKTRPRVTRSEDEEAGADR